MQEELYNEKKCGKIVCWENMIDPRTTRFELPGGHLYSDFFSSKYSAAGSLVESVDVEPWI